MLHNLYRIHNSGYFPDSAGCYSMSKGGKMEVSLVGKLVEHTSGYIDLYGWDFDCDCCSDIDEAAKTHRQELISLAKEAGTYSYEQ